MEWPFLTAVDFETKLSAEEVRKRLGDNLFSAWTTSSSFNNPPSLAEFPFTGRLSERCCKIYKRTFNRDSPARVLVLDLDSLRFAPVLRGVWRPAFSNVIASLAFASIGFFGCVESHSLLPALFVSALFGINLLVVMRRMSIDEPLLVAFVQQVLRAEVIPAGPMKRFEITPSLRPGRMQVMVGFQFGAKTEDVYRAFLNPDLARRFLFATTTGTMVRAEINARVGGEFNFVDRRDGVDVLHTGHYTALDCPTRIAFDFCVPMYSNALATVTLELEPTRPGCRLMLRCDGVLPEYAKQTRDGWESILAKADSVLQDSVADPSR